MTASKSILDEDYLPAAILKTAAEKLRTFYHGSPNAALTELRPGSYVTPDLATAELMGRFHEDTGKTWSDDDLAEPHKFGQEPKWKDGREPKGKPAVYAVNTDDSALDLLDNPYEHKTKIKLLIQKQAAKTFYHGTDSKNLKSILARGLDPEFAGTGADSGVPTDIPGYERRVFLATHPQINSGYGDARLKVELPEDFDVKPLFPWPLNMLMTDQYTTQNIPAKYIQHEKQADAPAHILVSGHSGAGKSTLAKALAEKLNLPLVQADKHPDFQAFFKNNPAGQETVEGSPAYAAFQTLRKRVAEETLANVKTPSVVEGIQFSALSPEQLAPFKRRIYVHTPLKKLLRQRLERQKQRALKQEKAWSPEIEKEKYDLGQRIYDIQEPLMQGFRKIPGTVKYTSGQDVDALIKRITKQADLQPDVQLQEHQQRIADKLTGEDPRLLVYHGLGSGKSLSAIAAAEAAKQKYQEDYGVVVPASLRANFQKEIDKFTTGSKPEIMSYTGLGLGKKFTTPPSTLIMDEAARLRNPGAASTKATMEAARQAKRIMLLTGTPITNEPSDIASLLSMVNNTNISPEQFNEKYVGTKKVGPGWIGWLRGIKPGDKPYIKNEKELRKLLQGKVDYQPSKTPEGVNVNEEVVRVPLSDAQQRLQHAIRTRIPPGFLWKLDQEFPLSKDELARLNSFLTGMRQVSLSTHAFRADKQPLKAFDQSSKLQAALANLKKTLDSDPRKKAIIYSNFIDSGVKPYAAALQREKIPYGVFHGSMPVKERQQALKDYNEGRLRALLLGPAAAEGISTKGTNLIQLLDPHWNEARLQQAQGRGLRFDSHAGLPEDLKDVQVQRYLSTSQDPTFMGKWLFGKKRERTADEVLERLTAEKEQFNEEFRRLLREIGSEHKPQPTVKASSSILDTPAEETLPPAAVGWLHTQYNA